MAGHRNEYGKRSHSRSDYSESGSNKRRNSGNDNDKFSIGPDDTVYRYLCPGRKIGSIIGKGGEIVKEIRADTKSKIRIDDSVPGCDERVVMIYSGSEKTNEFDGRRVCAALDALFRVHDRIVGDSNGVGNENDKDGVVKVTVRLLVPGDQIGCVIGKGGLVVQSIRSETGAHVQIMKGDHLPCALRTDELVQISGHASVVEKALYQVASRIHDNPSRSQHLLASSGPPVLGVTGGVPLVELSPIMIPYRGYKGESADWPRTVYSAPRRKGPPREFSLRLICLTANLGSVIGKGGAIINQIRQDSGAAIKVDSSAAAEADDCVISISAKEIFEDNFSPAIDAALRLQPRCSEKVERDSGIVSFTTRLLVPSYQIGCLIGKGGSIIKEMREVTNANIRILSKDLPKVASDKEEMVMISGEFDVAKEALIQVTSCLRADLFEKEGPVSALLPVLPYIPMQMDDSDRLDYESNREGKSHGHGYSSYSGNYGGSSEFPPVDTYGGYRGHESGSPRSTYHAYGRYESGQSYGSGSTGRNPSLHGRNYDY